MGPLSNFLRKTDASAPHASLAAAICRPARQQETEAALRHILGIAGRRADDVQVLDFLQFTVQRGINLADLWVAERGGRIVWATLPILSPGRTMLLLSGAEHPHRPTIDVAPGQLIEEVCRHYGARGIELAQALLEPCDNGTRSLYFDCGFRPMAELIYMQGSVRKRFPESKLSPELAWETYSPLTHDLFAQTIARSYQESLDCPALNGMRDIEDVIAGHKSSGEFDPQLWFLLRGAGNSGAGNSGAGDSGSGEALGMLLLSRMPHQDAIELVYLGVVPEARGHGLGPVLMKRALYAVASRGGSRLSLAVDSGNIPAIKLYQRHGMKRVGAKLAMMKELRTPKDVALRPVSPAIRQRFSSSP